MRKSIFRVPTPGKEYFCDKCHLYFGIDELVNQWNYDLGDFHIEDDELPLRAKVIRALMDKYYQTAPEENEKVDYGYPY